MNHKHETTPRSRLLQIFKAILDHPFHYSRKDFGLQFNVTVDTVKADMEVIKNAGFNLSVNTRYQYGIYLDKSLNKLKAISYLTDTEKGHIEKGLETQDLKTSEKLKIAGKLEKIYDATRFSNINATKTHIKKLEILEKALKDKQQVMLFNYRSSNANQVKDRVLEVYKISPLDDIIHALDLKDNHCKIFKISRFDRVEQIDEDWENEGRHLPINVDIFGISSYAQTYAHIKMNTAGVNLLLEQFPLAKARINPSPDQANQYELECQVNTMFSGLASFILGNSSNITAVLEPQELIDHLNEMVEKMKF